MRVKIKARSVVFMLFFAPLVGGCSAATLNAINDAFDRNCTEIPDGYKINPVTDRWELQTRSICNWNDERVMKYPQARPRGRVVSPYPPGHYPHGYYYPRDEEYKKKYKIEVWEREGP